MYHFPPGHIFTIQWFSLHLTLAGWVGQGSLALLSDQRLVYVGDDSASSDGRLDQSVQLFVSSDGQLEMSGGDSLHFEILGGITSQLEHFSSQVLQDGRTVHSGRGAHTTVAGGPTL